MTTTRARTFALAIFVLGGACAPGPDSGTERAPRAAPATTDAPDPTTPSWLVDEAAERGLVFTHRSGHGDRYLLPEITSGGAALFDLERDGDLDVYFVQSGGPATPRDQRPPNRLFRNTGRGRFEDVTDGSGADDRGLGNGVACGDYDRDGDVDLYVTNTGPNVLLRNDGGGRFTDVSRAAGVDHPGWGTSAAFFDHDRDGDLDLFVVNYVDWNEETERACPGSRGQPDYCLPTVYDAPTADVLYRNDGDGTFTDVSEEAGIAGSTGTGLGVLPADFDGDGWPDVFVANDGMLDRLWMGSENGRYEDRALRIGCATDAEGIAKAGMGVDAADLDGDGDLELLVGNLGGESDSLFRNELEPGGGRFDDVTASSALAGASRAFTRFGLGFVDFDTDGTLDLFEANGRVVRAARQTAGDPYAEPNLLLRGTPGSLRFELLEKPGSVAASRGAAFGDVNGDGRIDVLVVNRDAPAELLINQTPFAGRWLIVDVRDELGAPALGARVTLRAGSRIQRHDVRAAHSYQASSDHRLVIGVGDAFRIDAVEVEWPDRTTETFGPYAAERIVNLAPRVRRGSPLPGNH